MLKNENIMYKLSVQTNLYLAYLLTSRGWCWDPVEQDDGVDKANDIHPQMGHAVSTKLHKTVLGKEPDTTSPFQTGANHLSFLFLFESSQGT